MGYIKLDRKIQEWEWFGDASMLALWVHLLLLANWSEKEWRGEVIQRGSLVTSVSKLAFETGLSRSQVIYCLSKLKASGEIITESTNQHTRIRIVKYDMYQGDSEQAQVLPSPPPEPAFPPSPAPAPKPAEKAQTQPKKKRETKKDLVFPFDSEAFMTAWNALCQEPKWKTKTAHALQLSLDKLAKFDEAFAIERIYLAIERGWQGIVFVDTPKEYADWQKAHGQQLFPPEEKRPTNDSSGVTVAGYKRRKKW